MGTGLPGGGGLRLKYSQPIPHRRCRGRFPDMTIILAHPSWPWTDEALSMALHKENIYIDLSGWMPKYFPPQVVQYANGQLRNKMLFGSDFPLIKPDKWIAQFRTQASSPKSTISFSKERHPRCGWTRSRARRQTRGFRLVERLSAIDESERNSCRQRPGLSRPSTRNAHDKRGHDAPGFSSASRPSAMPAERNGR